MPYFRHAGTAVSGTGAVTPTWPAHDEGDIALLLVETQDEAVTLSTPSGFVQVADSPQSAPGSGGGFATRLTLFWCRATSSAMASPVVADSGDHQAAQILTFRGCVTTGNPWNVTAGDATVAASSTGTIPGDTTTVDGCLVVAICTTHTDGDSTVIFSGWTNADLLNIVEIADFRTSASSGGGFGAACGLKETAGAYGATTVTIANSSHQGRISVALEPYVAPVDLEAPTVTMITPDVGDPITRFTPATFRVADNSRLGLVVGWVKYAGSDERVLVYDGDAFVYPFEINSTADADDEDDPTQIDFSVLPNDGWQQTVEELRFRAIDSAGNLDEEA